MFTVKKLSEISGIPPDTIRFYVRKGLLSPGRDVLNGYRFFSDRDVRVLAFIQQAKLLGFSLNEIHGILQDSEKGRSPCAHVRILIKQKIEENRKRIQSLQQIQERMQSAMKQWNRMPDGIPDGHSICALIESTRFPEDVDTP